MGQSSGSEAIEGDDFIFQLARDSDAPPTDVDIIGCQKRRQGALGSKPTR
jgi:hypothetical protein